MSFGQLESLDHYGLGSWDPGAKEDGFGGWNWEDWDTVQPAQNTEEVEGMGPAALDGRDTTTIRAWDLLELEIPEEGTQVAYMPPDLTFDSNTPPSTFIKHGTSLVLDDSLAGPVFDRPAEGVVAKASLARNAASSADQWLCEHLNCGRAFTHRHKLKYVRSLGRILFVISNSLYIG